MGASSATTALPVDGGTGDTKEIAKFARIAASWWDEAGPFAPLHRLNPVRLGFIRDQVVAHFGGDGKGLRPLGGLRLLDLGCGGGLVAEPMARLGASVTGADADAEALSVARAHAAEAGLAIDYRQAMAEDLVAGGESFDIVLALEIVEHVRNVEEFLASLRRLVRPGGLLVMSTLNRTPQSFALGIVAAEYVLRWLPRGTHDWKRFRRPSELVRDLGRQGFSLSALSGMTYDPVSRKFALSQRDLSVNYLLAAR